MDKENITIDRWLHPTKGWRKGLPDTRLESKCIAIQMSNGDTIGRNKNEK